MKTLISCFLASILAFATCQGQEVGNWTVGDCLHARFALSLSLDLTNRTDLNETMVGGGWYKSIDVLTDIMAYFSMSCCP